MVDPRQWRARAARFDKRSDRILLPGRQYLDRTVGAVAHPAGDPQGLRPADGKIPEADLVNFSSYHDPLHYPHKLQPFFDPIAELIPAYRAESITGRIEP
jgi:hypothetical protein